MSSHLGEIFLTARKIHASVNYALDLGIPEVRTAPAPVEAVHVGGVEEVLLLLVPGHVLHDVGRDGLEGRRQRVRLVADEAVVLARAVAARVEAVLVHRLLRH